MTIQEMKSEVLKCIGVPEYIYEIVLPNMPEYYNGDYEVNFEVSRYMKCCFHNEDSPSFRWYENTNTYYCFGCGKGGRGPMGTVIGLHINFVERMNGKRPSEQEAIVFLYNYFIKERDIRSVFVQDVAVKKNDNVAELANFNMYKNELEKAITYDMSIDEDKKINVYDLMDNIDMMLFKDIISVNEARMAIDSAIKEL